MSGLTGDKDRSRDRGVTNDGGLTNRGANDHGTNRGVHDSDVEQRVTTRPAKTSAAAAFALAIGVAAFLCVLTVILSPVGLVLSIIGIILGIIGIKAGSKVGITGKGVAIAGLILSALALIASIAFAAGAVTVLNNEDAVNRIEQQVNDLRDRLPENVEVPQP